MRVLLTGGYGFIGAWIVRNLLQQGHQVWILDLREDPRRLLQIMTADQVAQARFIPGDITDLAVLCQALESHGITHIIHLAGLQVPACRADPLTGARVNVLGTLAVFEAARRMLGQVQRIVYASSAAVYGPPDRYPAGPLPEDVPLAPSTHYGVFKACNEGNARVYFLEHGLVSIGLRPWTVYGVGRDLGLTSEPTKAIKAALLGRPWHISFGGWTDFQYVDDVAQTFILCLQRPFHGARCYNLRGTVTTLQEFHQTLCQVLPQAERLVTVGSTQIAIAYDLSDDALQRDLGPMPKTSLLQGIQQTVDLFRQLWQQGRLDTSDLQTTASLPQTVAPVEP
ncbi:MAG: NAD(P)-dependent oxidoreductase [Gemmataceae bacterium]|nr:NAD(P)-dependent oxidoreductase [Gemmataceae bacterium]MCS7270590.1 NAD(P)-dependent oxidoreductase [Gemmataceae bacterium]MDW8242856.1 NAD(P)-dependent oxidoreductase [Thermogemmata sp.]